MFGLISVIILTLLSSTAYSMEERVKIGSVTVNITGLGSVEGAIETTFRIIRRTMYAFYGVPYGKDTSGQKRFMPSEHPDPWEETLDVQTPKLFDVCPQLLLGVFIGEEDCLKLYIYTPPYLPSDGNFAGPYPVMVYFHGGSFESGSYQSVKGTNLVDFDDVIIVAAHYRLSVLGFFCTHTEKAPCNAGLHDQVLALQFVKKYISVFGGDPDRVVIGGQSAGAVSVGHLMLYDGAAGLFRGVLSQSGSPLDKLFLDESPIESVLDFGILVNCTYSKETIDQFVECIKNVSVRDIVTQWRVYATFMRRLGYSGFSGASPVIEQIGTDKIITDYPINKLRSGNFTVVPYFCGTNLHEGSFVLLFIYASFIEPHGKENNEIFWRTRALDFLLNLNVTDNNASEEDLIQSYFNGIYPKNLDEALPGYIDAGGSIVFNDGCHQTASYVQQFGGNSYVYSFQYGELFSLFEPPFFRGTSHSAEMRYLFPSSLPIEFPLFTTQDREVNKIMLKMWTNFIKFLDPTADGEIDYGIPPLPPYSKLSRSYIEINFTAIVKSDYLNTWKPCLGLDGTENNCQEDETFL